MIIPILVSTLLLHPATIVTDAADDVPASTVLEFSLAASDGARVSLYEAPIGTRATVVTMTTLECPIARLLLPRLAELEREFGPRGVRFLAIDPNAHDTAADIEARRHAVGVGFPILRDPLHIVSDQLGVTRTTEVLLLGPDYGVIYRGATDDQYTEGARRPAPTANWLRDAISAALEGDAPAIPKTDPDGCLIGAATDEGADVPFTFHRDVAPIVNQHCVSCHRPGQIGPMSLLDPDTARSFSDMIAEVVLERRMPPWYANPRHGAFENDRRLTDTDKATLIRWAEAGAPLGDPADAPTPPVFDDEGWAIGTPDLIVQLPEPIEVAATGVIDYQYVVIDPQLTEDHWVEAIEIRPTAPGVTHHVLILEVPPGISVEQAANARDVVTGGYYAVYVPGARPNVYPDGMAKDLPAGTRFLVQMHYTPNGIAAVDQTRIAFRYSQHEEPIEVYTAGIANGRLRIPPRTRDVTYEQTRRFDWPVEVIAMFPHMHARGQSFRYELLDTDGEFVRVLLDVPVYDFNWQDLYRPVAPILIGEDESIRVTAVYDNSAENPNNPDPDKTVRWGDQTFEEMMIGYFDYIERDW